jgi:hypothetical protein
MTKQRNAMLSAQTAIECGRGASCSAMNCHKLSYPLPTFKKCREILRSNARRDVATTTGTKNVYLDKNKRKDERLKEYLRKAKDVPCADCQKKYPFFVMDFDHREDKRFSVGQLVYRGSWKRLLTEIAKCDVVCANCHRERTHQRLLAQ